MLEFTFNPVEVKGGRKFKGFAYDLGHISSYNVAYGVTCESAELWDPNSKKKVYANPKFIVAKQISDEEILNDKNMYIDSVFAETLKWCAEKASVKTDDEIRRFARNCMLKNYPEWREEIEARLPDTRQAIDVIERTLNWAMSRKTKACVMYGRVCKGGKDIPEKKKMLMAIVSLKRCKAIDLPGFDEAWAVALTLRGMQDYISWINE